MTTKYPPPIFSTEPGSWAQLTVTDRWPEIVNRVINENEFPPQILDQLIQLRDGIPDQPIRQLKDLGAPDIKYWESYITPRAGKNWLEIPWFFAEHYFYRRVLEAVDYFNLGLDPYGYQKEQGLIKTREDIRAYASVLMNWLDDKGHAQGHIRQAIYFSLWGNQADLSLWPAGSSGTQKQIFQQSHKDNLLADDTNQIIKLLFKNGRPVGRVDIMLDNAGFELVCDLGLADTLINHQLAAEVRLHVKAHPTFVSDVIDIDIDQTIEHLKATEEVETRNLGMRLEKHIQEKKITTKADFFWNSPIPMWELPSGLREVLSGADLLISKGDANYRRLLGDRQWDFTLPFHQVVDYLPVPMAALRTSKAELAVGLNLDQIREVYNQDPNWLIDGKWGMVHFSPGKNPEINRAHT
jgi:uncharacterized protein with ATP-grasp and redox domains